MVAACVLPPPFVELALTSGLFKELMSKGNGLINCLNGLPILLVLAKKLFAHKEHSYAEAVSLYVLVMPLAGADFLAILNGVAAQGHSGAVAITLSALVLCQPLLHDLYNLSLREELVGATGHVAFGELYRTCHRLF